MIDALAAAVFMLPADDTATPSPTPTTTVTPTPTPSPTTTYTPAPSMADVYAGKATLRLGMQGKSIETLQTQLVGIGKPTEITGIFDESTKQAYRAYQRKFGYWPTGVVRHKAATFLKSLYGNGKLPKACMTGNILCVDKSQLVLRDMKNGKVRLVTDVRFGSSETPTRNGKFRVYAKVKYLISDLSGTPMPWALFFSGGQAVHYSPGFDRDGYNGSSLGCVNVGSKKAAKWIFRNNTVGTPVLIYRSGR